MLGAHVWRSERKCGPVFWVERGTSGPSLFLLGGCLLSSLCIWSPSLPLRAPPFLCQMRLLAPPSRFSCTICLSGLENVILVLQNIFLQDPAGQQGHRCLLDTQPHPGCAVQLAACAPTSGSPLPSFRCLLGHQGDGRGPGTGPSAGSAEPPWRASWLGLKRKGGSPEPQAELNRSFKQEGPGKKQPLCLH